MIGKMYFTNTNEITFSIIFLLPYEITSLLLHDTETKKIANTISSSGKTS